MSLLLEATKGEFGSGLAQSIDHSFPRSFGVPIVLDLRGLQGAYRGPASELTPKI